MFVPGNKTRRRIRDGEEYESLESLVVWLADKMRFVFLDCREDQAPHRHLHGRLPHDPRDPQQRPPVRPRERQRAEEGAAVVRRVRCKLLTRFAVLRLHTCMRKSGLDDTGFPMSIHTRSQSRFSELSIC